MIKVNVYKQSNYPVSSPKIKNTLKLFFKEKGIKSNAEISVGIVNKEKMGALAKKHLKENPPLLHNVLSFTESEVKTDFKMPPDLPINLGEIVLCFDKVLEEAKKEGKLIDEKAKELVEHGALHLLGIHHE